jgi:hypothetical protein
MTKIIIPFVSNDHTKKESLIYVLHDHQLAVQWMNLVRKSQIVFDASYANNTEIYGIDSFEDLEIQLRYALSILKKGFPDIWKKPLFDPIRGYNFEIKQENLNLSHAFFEQATEKARENHHILTKFYKDLHTLNHAVHKFEHLVNKPEGIYVNACMTNTMFKSINPELNSLFSPDMKWGQLSLGYCHIGEDYMDSFRKNHPQPPVPQTKMSADFMLDFDHDSKFDQLPELQKWANEKFGKEINLSELPLGRVPLAQIESGYSKSEILEFFSIYTSIDEKIRFE